jgi:RNA polymerase sigma factor (TIGR02999 family)
MAAMDVAEPARITALLKAWSAGDTTAEGQLVPMVYSELKRLAKHYRRAAGGGDALQTTALVHEAYLRLVHIENVDWRDRVHFFAVSAQLMRRILVDAARARATAKRGAGVAAGDVDLDTIASAESQRGPELLALEDALTALEELDPRRARVVELRVFGGLTAEETADVLGISAQTVFDDWKLAKAWLLRELSR